MSKTRINELARELEVKPNVILDLLPEMGVQEKKTHSSSIEDDVALKIRGLLAGKGEPGYRHEDHHDEHHSDVLDILRPFVAYLVIKQDIPVFSAHEIKDQIRKEFGLVFALPRLETKASGKPALIQADNNQGCNEQRRDS